MAPDFIERLTIYTCQIRVHQRWQSYNPTSYISEEGVVAGHRGQFTPGGCLSTAIHITLAGIEPTTYRLLVQRATSSATKTTFVENIRWKQQQIQIKKFK